MYILLNKKYVVIIDCSGELIYLIMTTYICVYEMYVVMNGITWSLIFIIISVHFVKQKVRFNYWLFRWIHIVIMTTYICVCEMYVVMNCLTWSLIFIIIFVNCVKQNVRFNYWLFRWINIFYHDNMHLCIRNVRCHELSHLIITIHHNICTFC